MTSEFRSKFSGKPGSLVAIRVDYPLSSAAFEAHAKGSSHKKRHEEIDKFIRGPRIGDKVDWNACSVGANSRFPDRAQVRVNSEFQAVKLEYNYRAAMLPTLNHDTTFVPKPNKMQVDRSLFLSPQEKAKLVQQCPGTHTRLSRSEIGNGVVAGVQLETGWNVSTQQEEQRANIFKTVVYPSKVASNKAKGLVDEATYTAPHHRVSNMSQTMRTDKITQRSAATVSSASASLKASHHGASVHSAGGAPAVFKMSNITEWWDKCPIDLPVRSATDESAIDGDD